MFQSIKRFIKSDLSLLQLQLNFHKTWWTKGVSEDVKSIHIPEKVIIW